MNGYRKKTNYSDSYNVVPKGNNGYNRPICSNATLYEKLEDVEKLLYKLLYISGTNGKQCNTCSRSDMDQRSHKVAQRSASPSPEERFHKDQKWIDKYGLDHLYEERSGYDERGVRDGSTDNKGQLQENKEVCREQ